MGISLASPSVYDDPAPDFAINEIKRTYGHTVYPRKSLHKNGRLFSLGTTELPLSYLSDVNGGIAFSNSALFLTDNLITGASSSNAGDVGSLYIEGHTISDIGLTFVTQTIMLTGQTTVSLDTPLRDVTRLDSELVK